MIKFIAEKTNISKQQVENTIKLLNEDCTLPFISRYRKEVTGNLDEVAIGLIIKFKEQFEAFEKRKSAILKSLEEQGVLNTELKAEIEKAKVLSALEDIYLPFKKKRKTKAETARKNGLEPLAKKIMDQQDSAIDTTASKYLNEVITNKEQAFEGARHIISEWISEDASTRSLVRRELERYSEIETKVVKSKSEDEKALKFKDYFEWKEPFLKIPSHRLLAILRAEKEGFLRLKINVDEVRLLEKIDDKFIKSENTCGDQIEAAISDAYKRLLLPTLTTEAVKNAKLKADEKAIEVFGNNLEQLLLGAPLGEKRILALDPGFRSGCKVVCLNEQGDLVHNDTIYPHPPQNKISDASYTIEHLVEQFNIEAISIGNGTASRETERFVKKCRFKNDVAIFVVNEAGASIYSASKIARDEFPDKDVTVRGAVSIGRRLSDPLAELVKIDAKSIGVGQYQHDVDQAKLKKSLDSVVELCVNKVGVNVNTASAPLLSYVSGIGPKLADNIVKYREENGAFLTRSAIKKVPRLGGKAFEQSGGFLRVKNGDNPLDNSGVHPERYALVKEIAKDYGCKIEDLIGDSKTLKEIKLQNYVTASYGLPTLQDIVKELDKPGLDPRGESKQFSFDDNLKTIEDVSIGITIPGIVNNITNFGCFVDIGIKVGGLIHISNLSDSFVKDVNEHVQLNQQVLVTVLEVDLSRKRIQLKLEK